MSRVRPTASGLLFLLACTAPALAQSGPFLQGTPKTMPCGIGSQVGDYSQIAASHINNNLPGSNVTFGTDASNLYYMTGSIKIDGVTYTLNGQVSIFEGLSPGGVGGLIGGAAANGSALWLSAKAFAESNNAKRTQLFLHELLHCVLAEDYTAFNTNCKDCAHKWVMCNAAKGLCEMAGACPSPSNKADLVERANKQSDACNQQSCGPCSSHPQPPACSCPPTCNPPNCPV